MQRGNLILLGLVSALAACNPAPAPQATSTITPVETSAPAPVAPNVAIPEAFFGKWDTSVERCASATSDTHLTIAANEITYFESGGHVTKVDVASPHDISVTASMSGEGEAWDKTSHMTLSDDGGALTIDDIARVRCS